MSTTIRVEGLAEFMRDVRRFDRDLPGVARDASSSSGSTVARRAKRAIPLGPGAGGHARSSLKVRSLGSHAEVSAGGKRFPYYPWLDYGGAVGRRNSVFRPYIRKGRYIWRSFADNKAEITSIMERTLRKQARRDGLDVD